MRKFIEAVERLLPRGHYVEESGDRLYIYKEHDNISKKHRQSYVYMFYAQEVVEAPDQCLDLLKTILDMRV
jgi:hypothetical protein